MSQKQKMVKSVVHMNL